MLVSIDIHNGTHSNKQWFLTLLSATLLWLLGAALYASTASAQVVTPDPNPNLAVACGIDVALVLDASSSISDDVTGTGNSTSSQAQVRAATQSFVNSFANTGSSVAIVEFASIADTPIPYTQVNQNTLTDTFEPYINMVGSGDGYHDGRLGECTNWDDGFRQINALPSKPDLVVFMTDGQPNTVNGGAACGATVPSALDAAATQANITKSGSDGSHIFVIGIGDQVKNTQANLRSITEAPNQIYNTTNLNTADFTLGTFDSLYTNFQEIAFGLCAPSVTINKVVDQLDGNGEVPHPDQSFVGELAVNSGSYTWSSPGTPVGNNHQGTTDSSGNLTFQWDRSDLSASSTITISENVQNGYSFVNASCMVKTFDNPVSLPLPITVEQSSFTAQVDTGDLVTCEVHNARHQIAVQKSAAPTTLPEPGGAVTYTFQVTNLGATSVTLDTLVDDRLGDLNGQGSCQTHTDSAPINIASGQSYLCSMVKNITGNAGESHTNMVTATAANANGTQAKATDQATVTITDIQPTAIINKSALLESLPEPGGAFTFTVAVTNTSAVESLTLLSLTDAPFGDVTTVSNDILATDCATPQALAPFGQSGAVYSCQFVVNITGIPSDYTDIASAVLEDDEENEITVSNGAAVSVVDLLPAATIQVAPNPIGWPEPGGLFAFTVTISNSNPAESITVDSLTDSLYGSLALTNASLASTTCQAGQSLAPTGQPGDSYSCIFSVEHSGNPAIIENRVIAQISDDDNNQLAVSADSQVEITDSPSALEVTQTADRLSVREPGEEVTFTITIKNVSNVDAITISAIVGASGSASPLDIAASCFVSLPITLAPDESFTCTYSRFVSGNAGDAIDSTLNVVAVDDDGLPLEESAEESIDILDLPSAIKVTTLADVSEVMEPGDDVNYTVTVENTSAGDSVTINTLVDDRFGDVSGNCDLSLPTTLAPSEILTCPFIDFVGGVVGTTHVNIVTASGVDDDGNDLTASDQEEIDIDNVPSSIKVIETASPSGVAEPGADVTFTAIVRNTSAADSVMITRVVRLVGAEETDISNSCLLIPPVVLAPGEEITCQFTDFINGTGGDSYSNQIQAFGEDDDGNPVTDFDLENVDVLDVSSSIRIKKQTSQPTVLEPSGVVSFTISVKNTSLVDSVTVEEIEHKAPTVAQRGSSGGNNGVGGTCDTDLPITLVPGESFGCESTELISGSVGAIILSESTVRATDDDGNALTDSDQSAVEITDVPSALRVELTAAEAGLSEPGGSVIFTARIENSSTLDSITLQSVNSDQGDDVSTSCEPAISAVLAPGAHTECTYTLTFFGDQGDSFTDSVTTTGLDDDGMMVSDQDSAQVDIVNLLPTISVRKTVSPTDVPETGGDVTFTFEVVNNSASETVDLLSMQDASLGDLNGQGNCTIPQFLTADGGSYTCTVSLFVQGDFGNNESAEVRATAVDNDGSEDVGFDIQEIFFTDVLPDIGITSAISPSTIIETGQNVSHALIVSNNSAEEVVIDSLTDSSGGSLDGLGTCSLPQTLVGNGTYACGFTRFISGTFGSPQTNIVVAVGADDEENVARAANSNTILFSEVAPVLVVSKTDGLLIDTFDNAAQQGLVSAGDTLVYTITVSNLGNEVASGVQLFDTPDASTRLIVGSVQSTKGTVITGNVAGDTTVLIDIGLLSSNETVVVTFNVLVDPIVTDIQLIGNQAQVSYTSPDEPGGVATVVSDDPATVDGNDETKTTITFAPQSLETNDEPLAPTTISDYIFLPMITK